MSLKHQALTAAAVAATALSAVAVAAGDSPEPQKRAIKTVQVGDDYFAPISLKVKSGGKVRWNWVPTNLNTHNVILTNKHPDGVKPSDFISVSGSTGVRFNRKFEVPGKYAFVCTFHRSVMRLDLKVRN